MKKYYFTLLALLIGMTSSVNAQHFGSTYHHDRHYDYHYDYHRDTYHHVHHYDHHDDASVAGVLVGALIGGAIVAAVESSNNSQPAHPVQPVQSTSYNRGTNNYTASLNNSFRYGNSNANVNVAGNQLQHYSTNGISYESNQPYARITKVEATPSKTVVYFEYLRLDRSTRLGINQNVYLKDRVTNQKIYPIACNGVSMDQWMDIQGGDAHQYSITFPAINVNCHSIDIVEPNDDGKKFYQVVF